VAIRAVRSGEGRACGRVHRVIRTVVVSLVAIRVRATCRSAQAIATRRGGMALRALHGEVQAGQREPGVVVIEGRICPQDRIVAGLAGLREARRNVIRNASAQSLRTGPIGGMARVASPAGQAIVIAHVTLVSIRDHAGRGHLVITHEWPIRRSV